MTDMLKDESFPPETQGDLKTADIGLTRRKGLVFVKVRNGQWWIKSTTEEKKEGPHAKWINSALWCANTGKIQPKDYYDVATAYTTEENLSEAKRDKTTRPNYDLDSFMRKVTLASIQQQRMFGLLAEKYLLTVRNIGASQRKSRLCHLADELPHACLRLNQQHLNKPMQASTLAA